MPTTQVPQQWADENPLKLSPAIGPVFVPPPGWSKMQYSV
jgi:hypothetical protein